MTKKGLIALLIAAQGVLFSGIAVADVVFKVEPSVCTKLVGDWQGEGAVTALSGLVKCSYNGAANVTAGKDSSAFNMHVILSKTSGAVCPSSEDLSLTGTCDNGVLTLRTPQANISGIIDPSGSTARVSGTVSFKAPVVGNITATIKYMNLHKTSK